MSVVFGSHSVIISNMNKKNGKRLPSVVFRLLKPLVRLLLRQGMPFREFSELARRAYVDVATDEFTLPGRKQSVSRVSVLTGINRKDIARLQQKPHPLENDSSRQQSRASRVLNGWIRDAQFHNDDGQPAVLPIEGEQASFQELVRLHSGDVPWRAMLDELQRIKLVEQEESGQVILQQQAYTPEGDQQEQLRIFGNAVSDLLTTIDFNLDNSHNQRRFQRSVVYNNIPNALLQHIQARSEKELQEMLLQINQWLSQYEGEPNSNSNDDSVNRVGIGIYYFEEEVCPAQKTGQRR